MKNGFSSYLFDSNHFCFLPHTHIFFLFVRKKNAAAAAAHLNVSVLHRCIYELRTNEKNKQQWTDSLHLHTCSAFEFSVLFLYFLHHDGAHVVFGETYCTHFSHYTLSSFCSLAHSSVLSAQKLLVFEQVNILSFRQFFDTFFVPLFLLLSAVCVSVWQCNKLFSI